MIRLGEAMMILELHRQGLSVTAIARRMGRDPKTVRKYIERGVEVPVYGPRQLGRPCKIAPYMEFLRERVRAFPDLTASQPSKPELSIRACVNLHQLPGRSSWIPRTSRGLFVASLQRSAAHLRPIAVASAH